MKAEQVFDLAVDCSANNDQMRVLLMGKETSLFYAMNKSELTEFIYGLIVLHSQMLDTGESHEQQLSKGKF